MMRSEMHTGSSESLGISQFDIAKAKLAIRGYLLVNLSFRKCDIVPLNDLHMKVLFLVEKLTILFSVSSLTTKSDL